MLPILRFIFLVVSLSSAGARADGLSSLTGDEVQKLEVQGALVVDIRTPEEWKATGVIPGSKSGHRSGEAGKLLAAEWPDRKILHLGKGISEWIREGKPISRVLP